MHSHTLRKHVRPNWWDFADVQKVLYQKYTGVCLLLAPTDDRNEIICQKQANFYQESGRELV